MAGGDEAGLGRSVDLTAVRWCGEWSCALDDMVPAAEEEEEAAGWECDLCGVRLQRPAGLPCSNCQRAACVLCWLRVVAAKVAGGSLWRREEGDEHERWPACPFCRRLLSTSRVVQLAALHARHRDQLPFPLPVLNQMLRVGGRFVAYPALPPPPPPRRPAASLASFASMPNLVADRRPSGQSSASSDPEHQRPPEGQPWLVRTAPNGSRLVVLGGGREEDGGGGGGREEEEERGDEELLVSARGEPAAVVSEVMLSRAEREQLRAAAAVTVSGSASSSSAIVSGPPTQPSPPAAPPAPQPQLIQPEPVLSSYIYTPFERHTHF